MSINQQSSDAASSKLKTQKREVTLIKDLSMGFGFIAGSEKPLVIRFVSPAGPGQNKLLNGDEILAINGENVEHASRDYVINLIRNSSDQLKLVVKQPTVIFYLL
jgi:predicted metalloprotease with PDZ domain